MYTKLNQVVNMKHIFLICVFTIVAPYLSVKKMRAVQLKSFGGVENMYVSDDVPIPELTSADHILICVAAAGVNRADTIQRKGFYMPPNGETDILGLEASGIVEKIGENVTEFRVGDHVMALLGGGGYAEYVSVHKYQVMFVPEGIDLVLAASIPEVWLTAYQLIHLVAKIQPNESVLIHAAGSGVGTAAIQLAKQIPGCHVIATAGTMEKLEKAKELGADVLINYKTTDFAEFLREVTKGQGVNVILDPVGASFWQKNLAILSLEGRWVLYGLLGGGNVDGSILSQLLMKRGSLLTTTLRTRSLEYKKNLVESFAKSSIEKFASRVFLPVIDSIMTLDQVVDAHERMEANITTGKILMTISNEFLKAEL